MKRWTLHIITLVIMTLGTFSTAQADYLPRGTQRQDAVSSAELVRAYLRSESFMASRLELRKHSPDVVADLVDLVDDRQLDLDTRARAIKSLSLYQGDERARTKMEGLFERTSQRHRLYPQIIVSYMEQRGEDVAEDVAPLLRSRHKPVRLAAVIALGRFGGQHGYEQLLEAERHEQDTQVLERISRYTH